MHQNLGFEDGGPFLLSRRDRRQRRQSPLAWSQAGAITGKDAAPTASPARPQPALAVTLGPNLALRPRGMILRLAGLDPSLRCHRSPGRTRIQECRRIASRDERCPKVFLSVIACAEMIIFWP